MLRWILVACLSGCAVAPSKAVGAAPTPAARDQAVVHPPVEPGDGFVLLHPQALVRDAPADEATVSDIRYASAQNYPFTYGRPHPGRFVGRSGDFYAIASGPGPGHCHPHRGLFEQFEITVFVHERDLAETVIRPVDLTFTDGTALQLSPGVALGSLRRDGRRSVYADPLEIVARLPADAVGTAYHPVAVPADGVRIDAEILGCDGQRCRLAIGDGWARIATDYVEVATIAYRGATALVALDAPCASVRARVHSEALRVLPEQRTFTGMGSGCGGITGEDFFALPQAAVFWPDGRAAGRVGAERVALHRHHSRLVGERRCFKRHPTKGYTCGSDGRYLELCLDQQELTTVASTSGSE